MDLDIAPIAGLLADRARVEMLWAVSDGRHLSAGSLAEVGQVSPSAATAHLTKLVSAGLLAVERQGRRRLYRLANPTVIAALEALAAVAPAPRAASRAPTQLHLARTCFDHLAGALGVRVTDVLIARGAIVLSDDAYTITASGEGTFAELGVDTKAVASGTRRAVARPCLDWSERRHHLAGALGAALISRWIAAEWFERLPDTRALTVTPQGRRGFRRLLGITVDITLR